MLGVGITYKQSKEKPTSKTVGIPACTPAHTLARTPAGTAACTPARPPIKTPVSICSSMHAWHSKRLWQQVMVKSLGQQPLAWRESLS